MRIARERGLAYPYFLFSTVTIVHLVPDCLSKPGRAKLDGHLLMETILQEIFQQWEVIKVFFAFDTARLAEPDMIVRLGVQVLLLCSSAFFSGSETALFSLSRLDLQKLRRERNRHTETLHALMDQPRRLIISILCGNELVNIAAAANMTGILVVLYGVERAGWISVLVMVPLLLLFGEVTPKTISVSNPVRVSTGMVATPMSLWVRLVAPLVWVIRGIADRIRMNSVPWWRKLPGRESSMQPSAP
jgi:hypothetical protein